MGESSGSRRLILGLCRHQLDRRHHLAARRNRVNDLYLNGRHGCPGDALARLLAACTVQALLSRGIQPARLVDRVRYRPSVNARIPLFYVQP